MPHKSLDSIAFVIQARLTSERAPRKMIRPFSHSSLIDISLEKIRQSSVIPWSQFYLAVHEPELVEAGARHGANIFHRSRQSMMSEGSPMSQLYEWWDRLPHTYVVLVSACMPMLRIDTIDAFARAYMETEADGLFGVRERRTYFFAADGTPLTDSPAPGSVMNTKYVSPVYEAAHCLYAGPLAKIGQGIWMGEFQRAGDPELFVVPDDEAVDIDTEFDFTIAELLYKERKRVAESRTTHVGTGNLLA